MDGEAGSILISLLQLEAGISETMPICVTFKSGYCFKNQKVTASLGTHFGVRTQAVFVMRDLRFFTSVTQFTICKLGSARKKHKKHPASRSQQ